MEWINGETQESKIIRKQKWHKWFAWFPVVVEYVIIDKKIRKVKIWLDYVNRKGTYHTNPFCYDATWTYEYEKLDKDNN
jgi:hypothetical protein